MTRTAIAACNSRSPSTIPSPSGPVVDHAATKRMAAGASAATLPDHDQVTVAP